MLHSKIIISYCAVFEVFINCINFVMSVRCKVFEN